jgi:hypothetical protein
MRERRSLIRLCTNFGTLLVAIALGGALCGQVTDVCAAQTLESAVPEGNVLNRNGRPVGSVEADGVVYNSNKRRVGKVDSSGTVYNVSNIVVGKVEPGGTILNRNGRRQGSVDADGTVYNINGRFVGKVRNVASTILAGGAALLLLL